MAPEKSLVNLVKQIFLFPDHQMGLPDLQGESEVEFQFGVAKINFADFPQACQTVLQATDGYIQNLSGFLQALTIGQVAFQGG